MTTLRRVNDINREIESQIDYYENNSDYSDNYIDMLGDTLQYDDRYTEDDIYKILDSELTTATDYSYLADDAVATFPVGEIELQLDTDLTEKEYEAIKDKIDYPSTYCGDYILVYVCSGMNVRVYSDADVTAREVA